MLCRKNRQWVRFGPQVIVFFTSFIQNKSSPPYRSTCVWWSMWRLVCWDLKDSSMSNISLHLVNNRALKFSYDLIILAISLVKRTLTKTLLEHSNRLILSNSIIYSFIHISGRSLVDDLQIRFIWGAVGKVRQRKCS